MTATALLDLLDRTPRDAREATYSASAASLSLSDIQDALRAKRKSADWLVTRFFAGPPGTPLPDRLVALKRLMTEPATCADAYAVLFDGDPLPAEPFLHVAIQNAAASAIQNQRSILSAWLVTCATIAYIVDGELKKAELWFDLDAKLGEMPMFEVVRPLRPLLGRPDLLGALWARRAAWGLWNTVKLPAVPELPLPDATNDPCTREDFLEAVGEIGDEALNKCIKVGLGNWDADVAERLEEHPTICQIRDSVLRGLRDPPNADAPDGLLEWVRMAHSRGQHAAARLGALLLFSIGHASKELALYVLFDLGPSDIQVVIHHVPEELRSTMEEADSVFSEVPPLVANLLASVVIPLHPGRLAASEALVGHLDTLQALASPERVWLCSIIDWLSAIRDETGANCTEQLCAAIRCVYEDVGELARVPLDELDRSLSKAPPLDPERDMAGLASLQPGERLVGALLLRRVATGKLRCAAAQVAAQELWDMRLRQLFPLRLTLLEEVIGEARDSQTLAWALKAMANTRGALASDGVDEHRACFLLFMRAADIAHKAGDVTNFVDATKCGARLLTYGLLDEPNHDSLRADALRSLDEALSYPVEPGLRAATLWTKASILMHSGLSGLAPDAPLALPLLKEALTLADDDYSRLAIGLDLSFAMRMSGDTAAAITLARGTLDRASLLLQPADLASHHGNLADHLRAAGETVEAERHYCEALRLLGDDGDAGTVIVQYAQLLMRRGKARETRDILGRMRNRERQLSRADRVYMWLLLGDANARLDEPEAALDSWRTALEWGAGTSLEPVLLARITQLKDDRVGTEEICTRYLRGEWPQAPSTDEHIEEILDSIALEIAPDLNALALDWSRARNRPRLEARLLAARGDTSEALAVLDRTIQSGRSGDKMGARLFKIAVVQEHDIAAYRETIEAIQVELDDPRRLPGPQLCDLATACSRASAGELGWLNRALRYVEHAFEASRGEGWREHAAWTWVRIVRDCVMLNVVASTPTQCLTVQAALPAVAELSERSEHVALELVVGLLLAGALTHPERVATAAAVLDRLRDCPDKVALLARTESIRRVRDASDHGVVPTPATYEVRIPFDDNPPDWLVNVIVRELHGPPPAALIGDEELVMLAVRVRPDRADRLLAEWLRGASALGQLALDKAAESARICVELGEQGPSVWRELRALVQALKPASSRAMAALQRALQFTTHAGDFSGDTERSLADNPIDHQDDEALFKGAVASMHAAKVASDEDEQRKYKDVAIRDLNRLREAWHGLPNEADVLVSLGNAYRLEPDADILGAIRLYEEVLRLPELHGMQLGKLHKVWCDALLKLGGAEQTRLAWNHVQQALRHRREGFTRAETLLSAAQVARVHPDWGASHRTMTSARLLAEAVQVDRVTSEQLLSFLLADLAKWKTTGEQEAERAGILRTLEAAYPQHARLVEQARLGVASGPSGLPPAALDEQERLVTLMEDPDFQEISRAQFMLLPAAVVEEKLEPFFRGPHPAMGNEPSAEEHAERLQAHDVENSTLGLQTRLKDLQAAQGIGDAGRAVASALIRIELLCRGATRSAEVKAAIQTARERLALPSVSGVVRVEALVILADALSPVDTVADPSADFSLAAELAEEAVALEGGEENASSVALSTLGRAFRYRRDGEIRDNLLRAHHLFGLCVTRDRAANDGDRLSLDLLRLSEVETYLAEGDDGARLRRAEQLRREALAVAVSLGARALAASSLAWTLTLLGMHLARDKARSVYKEALELYSESRKSAAQPTRGNDNNEAVCRQNLAELEGQPDEAVAIWRERERALRRAGNPMVHAEAQHNLAEALFKRRSEGDLWDAIQLFREALRFRTREADLQKHFQSAFGLGRTLLALIEAEEEPEDAWYDEAERLLRVAISAGRELGAGRELARAAQQMGHLALFGSGSVEVERLANEAWAALRGAMPYLLLQLDSRIQEALLAEKIAFAVANHGTNEDIIVPLQGGVVLGRRASERVIRWLLRADAPYQRMLEAQFRLPSGVSVTERLAWQDALTAGREQELVARLGVVHNAHPNWLRADSTLATTERWLKASPGSVAIGIWPGLRGALVGLLDGDSRNLTVMVLRGPQVPLREDQLAQAIRDEDNRSKLLGMLVDWTDKTLLHWVRQFLGRIPKRILWVPHGALRMVPPSRIFPQSAVSVSATLALRAPVMTRVRSASNVVVLADPDTPRLGLGPHAVTGARELARVLNGARLVVGVGKRAGQEVCAEATAEAPSVSQVILEFDHAGFAVVIAHGHTEGVQDAWIDLLGPEGKEERLDIATLAQNPGSIAGLSILLLSCEAGRAGAVPDQPGGVAGALLLAGAKEVIAPLWPISLTSALAVGESLCRARALGQDLAQALAVAAQALGAEGPGLGRPAPERRSSRAWDPAAFVIWVG